MPGPRGISLSTWALLAVLLGGCSDPTTPSGPFLITAVSGVGQSGEVGVPLPEPVGFSVTDAQGDPVSGLRVRFLVSKGRGSVPSPTGVTGEDGVVQTTWTLGTSTATAHELTARVAGRSGSVDATALAGPASSVEAVAGNDQTGLAGETLPEPLAVRVTDRFGNPVPDAVVSWMVQLGGGSISPTPGTTDAQGEAHADWTLGVGVGENTAEATAGGAAPAPLRATSLPSAVIEGTVTVTTDFLAPPLGSTPSPTSWGSAGEAPMGGDRLDSTVPGEWIVKLRDASRAAAGPGRPLAAVDWMRASAASIPAVAEGNVSVEGVSPVLGAVRILVPPGRNEADVLAALRDDPAVEWLEPVRMYHIETPAGDVVGAKVDTPRTIPTATTPPRSPPLVPAPVSPLTEERYYPRQAWNYGLIGLPLGWEVTQGSPAVVVAVVDDGVRFDHVSVAPNLTNDGYDFVSDVQMPLCAGGNISNAGDGDGPDSDPTIPASYSWNSTLSCATGPNHEGGHGLHVTGTVAAAAGGSGLLGVAPGVRVRPVRVIGTTGEGTDWDTAQGILYAAGLPADDGAGGIVQAPSGAPVINLSIGGPPSVVVQEAVERASAAGSLLVAAAGTDGASTPIYPAGYPQTLSVSAVGPSGGIASYSNHGSTIDIAAPGGDLVAGVWSSTWDFAASRSLIASATGTSMAAPHVSGTAALVFSRNPGMTAAQVRDLLFDTADDLGNPGRDDFYGHGLLNAYLALTDGLGFSNSLRVSLVDAASGAVVARDTPGNDGSFRFPGLADGSYFLYAGLDDRGNGVTGNTGSPWGALGTTAMPMALGIEGNGVRDGSFTIGRPMESEPNGSTASAGALALEGYAYGMMNQAGDQDYYRVQIPQSGSYTFETGGWVGMCGWALEEDTVLDLYDSVGSAVASNDDADASRDRYCSSITANLGPGTYILRVSGFGKGRYTVRAR